jgi:hypothetical protein
VTALFIRIRKHLGAEWPPLERTPFRFLIKFFWEWLSTYNARQQERLAKLAQIRASQFIGRNCIDVVELVIQLVPRTHYFRATTKNLEYFFRDRIHLHIRKEADCDLERRRHYRPSMFVVKCAEQLNTEVSDGDNKLWSADVKKGDFL